MAIREVYDFKNRERLLGTWHEAPDRWRDNGRTVSVAIAPSLRALHEPTCRCCEDRLDIRRIEFRLGHKDSHDGYDKKGVLLTDAPLEYLLTLRGFLLPGETIREAEYRRWRAGF